MGDCGSTGELKSLRVDGCVTPPCRVKRGTTLHIAFDFVPKTDSDDIASKLTGKFSGVEAPWPGKLPEGCDMLTTGESPLKPVFQPPQNSTSPSLPFSHQSRLPLTGSLMTIMATRSSASKFHWFCLKLLQFFSMDHFMQKR